MDSVTKATLTAVLNKVRNKELTVEAAKEILEMAGIVEMKKVYKKKSVSSSLMNQAGPNTTFIISGE